MQKGMREPEKGQRIHQHNLRRQGNVADKGRSRDPDVNVPGGWILATESAPLKAVFQSPKPKATSNSKTPVERKNL